jgi:EpsI family protein
MERNRQWRHPNHVSTQILPLIAVALGLFAFRDLYLSDPGAGLSSELQGWLLTPSNTSPSVILAISGWLLYRRRAALFGLPRKSGPAALVAGLLGGGLSVVAWATYASAPDLLVPALMLVVLGVGCLYWGTASLGPLALPVGFLIFAIPIPPPLLNVVVFRLQIWTADLSGWLLWAVGIPAFVSGDQILRESTTFTIVEGCSGMRTVETLTMLTFLMVDLFHRRGLHVVLLVAIAPVIAFGVNGLRAIFLILNPLAETVTIHNLQGIVMLLVGLMMIYGIDGLLERFLPAVGSTTRTPKAGSGAASADGTRTGARGGATAPWIAAGVLGIAAVLTLALPVWHRPPIPRAALRLQVPEEVGAWRSTALETDRVFLGRVGFDDSLERRYRRGGDAVDLFVGVSRREERRRAPFSPKTLRPGSGWVVEEASRAELTASGREVDSRLLRSGSRRLLVYHWTAGDGGLADESIRNLLALDSSPMRREGHGVVIRLATEVGGDSGGGRRRAEVRINRFAEAVWGALTPLGNGSG